MRTLTTLACLALFCTGTLAAGYAEKKKGDLSNDGLNPTSVKLTTGDNFISGKYGVKNGVTDRDYFTIKIAAGQQLSALILEPETKVGFNVSFIGVQAGDQVTVPPVGGQPDDLLGWTHYGTADEGTDLLPAIGEGAGAQGFVPPLGPGTYSFWVQETSACKCQYKFKFLITTPAE